MQKVTREYLLELDKKRTQIEKEIFDLTEFLTGPGMPGVEGKLIDREGFPIAGVDLMAVRVARNKLIMYQNDLKSIMKVIEENMALFFKNAQEENQIIPEKEKYEDKSEPLKVQVFEEENKPVQMILNLPFAWIDFVSEGSPAEEAGLKAGDGIILFDTLYYGLTNNPLQKIAEIVSKNVEKGINVQIMRKSVINGIEVTEFPKIVLTPHKWSGQGVLGCKLKLSE
jgi:26S proteasome non-ATPase regulatory subunit 9